MRWAEHVVHMRERSTQVGKPKGGIALGRYIDGDNIKINTQEFQ